MMRIACILSFFLLSDFTFVVRASMVDDVDYYEPMFDESRLDLHRDLTKPLFHPPSADEIVLPTSAASIASTKDYNIIDIDDISITEGSGSVIRDMAGFVDDEDSFNLESGSGSGSELDSTPIVAKPTVAKVEITKTLCQRKRDNEKIFIPKCTDDGQFFPVQCFDRYHVTICACVNIFGKPFPDTVHFRNKQVYKPAPFTYSDCARLQGGTLEITSQKATRSTARPTTTDATTTQVDTGVHRRITFCEYKHLVNRAIYCTIEGNFRSLQCRYFGCYCVDSDGRLISDFFDVGAGIETLQRHCDSLAASKSSNRPVVTSTSMATRDDKTLCQRKRDDALKEAREGLMDNFIPVCAADGQFVPVQCYAMDERECWCVDKQGARIPGSSRILKRGSPALDCKPVEAATLPSTTIRSTSVTTPMVTESLSTRASEATIGITTDATIITEREKTVCEKLRDLAIWNGKTDYIPSCTTTGEFSRLQCTTARERSCWCVDEQGMEISGTRKIKEDGTSMEMTCNNVDSTGSNSNTLEVHLTDEKSGMSFDSHMLLIAIIVSAGVTVVTAIIVVVFVVHRMKKKDHGSYLLSTPEKTPWTRGSVLVHGYINPADKEYLA